MDTLAYWYSDAVGAFADVSQEEFLDEAERWIVDKWGVTTNPWRWDDEPRQDRLSGQSFSTHNRDGSLPTGERFRTYLEWHAMWCTIGQFMKERALADLEDDDYDSLARQIAKNSLSEPPIWLADLNRQKPLAKRFWVIPSKIDEWIENITDDDFLCEVLTRDRRLIVVGAYIDNSCRYARNTSSVHSALVSPCTSSALVRALQTVPHYANYRFPSTEEEFEIDNSPYKLKGWITDARDKSGIDERDPLRFDISPIQSLPSREVSTHFDLDFAFEDQPRWRRKTSGELVFEYRAWSDVQRNDGGERIIYDDTMYSTGYQLVIDSKALTEYLSRVEMDLIVEIHTTRSNRGDETRYDQKDAKELVFDRLILLRRDGSIEAAEGRLGTWKPSGARAKAP